MATPERARLAAKSGPAVATAEKRGKDKETGKLTTVTVKKFASAHDYRRAFGTRWAKRVMPAVLKSLMRHSEIGTTMKYYVTMDADSVAVEVWGRDWDLDNNQGNNHPKQPPITETVPADDSTETVKS
jgi:integrase